MIHILPRGSKYQICVASSQRPYPEMLLGPESFNVGYLDPLGYIAASKKWGSPFGDEGPRTVICWGSFCGNSRFGVSILIGCENIWIHGPSCMVHLVRKEYCRALEGGGSKGEGYLRHPQKPSGAFGNTGEV